MVPAESKARRVAVAPKRISPHAARSRSQTAPKQRRANPARALWAKAQVAAQSARVLLDAGDCDGAANRTYYTVFSAARAVLARFRASLADSKGHSTIVRRFEKHLIQERGLDLAFGRSFFGRLSHARWVSDYSHVGVEEPAARAMLGEAERFLVAVEPFLRKATP